MSDDLSAVLNLLVPGDGGRWPCFASAVNTAALIAALPPPQRAALARVARLDAPERPGALQQLEQDDPALMQALLRAVTAAYYTAPAVQEAVRTLADGGPREASTDVDPALVAGVLIRARKESK